MPQSITNYIYDKIGELRKSWQNMEPGGVIEVWVEIGRTTKHHRQGAVYRAECNIVLPGKLLRAEHQDWDVRRCIDEIKNKLQAELKKYMGKMRPQDSRGQKVLRRLKEK